MIVSFKKCELKIDEIRKDEISNKDFESHEKKVIELISEWLNNKPAFLFRTSGSTGQAKIIQISREKIKYSCEATMQRLDPARKFQSSFLCINPEMIGGAMVVFRALIRNLDLKVVSPQSNPTDQLTGNDSFDFTSMVPLQLRNLSDKDLDRFNTILAGGSGYDEGHRDTSARIYSTFGMTETASHFALRRAGDSDFECTGDAIVRQGQDNRLHVRGTITNNEWLVTNDLVNVISDKKFRWTGRDDFIINSGGVKINPEVVEKKLKNPEGLNFIITSLPDEKLGNKVVLITEGKSLPNLPDFSMLQKYEKPREAYSLKKFAHTPSGKIDRIKTRALLLSQIVQD